MAIDTIAVTRAKPASFIDARGAAVNVPADQINLYTMLKSEQLSVLNDLIADQAAGFQIELTENMVTTLAGLASELAHVTNKLVTTLTEDAPSHKKGGA